MATITLASSYDEIKVVFPAFYLEKKVDELKRNFRKYDIDGSEYLEFNEVKLMLESIGQPRTHLKVLEMVEEATGGRDNKISFHDFCSVIHPKQAEGSTPTLFGAIYNSSLADTAKHFEKEMAKNKGIPKEDLEAQVRSEAGMRKEIRKETKEKAKKEAESKASKANFAAKMSAFK